MKSSPHRKTVAKRRASPKHKRRASPKHKKRASPKRKASPKRSNWEQDYLNMMQQGFWKK